MLVIIRSLHQKPEISEPDVSQNKKSLHQKPEISEPDVGRETAPNKQHELGIQNLCHLSFYIKYSFHMQT
jgi:hypothetical protein